MEPAASSDNGLYRKGTGVQVQTRFDGHWASGFEIAGVRRQPGGPAYAVRRRSDNAVLPELFRPTELRRDG